MHGGGTQLLAADRAVAVRVDPVEGEGVERPVETDRPEQALVLGAVDAAVAVPVEGVGEGVEGPQGGLAEVAVAVEGVARGRRDELLLADPPAPVGVRGALQLRPQLGAGVVEGGPAAGVSRLGEPLGEAAGVGDEVLAAEVSAPVQVLRTE
ncbi:hypothetical protein ACFYYB_13470 [Streptomyces sp. NPDC002886]|uniref:hypothetical protein n=1 Tax=Streptomyces sp. NPDC002886 TaxID=3364667 RepID=UPI0036771EA4